MRWLLFDDDAVENDNDLIMAQNVLYCRTTRGTGGCHAGGQYRMTYDVNKPRYRRLGITAVNGFLTELLIAFLLNI